MRALIIIVIVSINLVGCIIVPAHLEPDRPFRNHHVIKVDRFYK